MAQDAVDVAVTQRALHAGPCRTRQLPLVGAAPREILADIDAPDRLVRRYGTEAAQVLAVAQSVTGDDPDSLMSPIAPDIAFTMAELVFGVTHDRAIDVGQKPAVHA